MFRRLVTYDSERRRLWLLGQRCHHGATGVLVAGFGLCGMSTSSRHCLALVATGGALMLHDRKDYAIWFERGAGTQP